MSRYNPDALADIITEVESQGGAFLPEVCEGRFARYAIPGSDRVTKATTCHCDQESMAVIVYDPADTKKGRERVTSRGGGFARVCINCDHVGEWPRFDHVLKEEKE